MPRKHLSEGRVQLTVRLPADLYETAAARARDGDISLNRLIESLLRRHLAASAPLGTGVSGDGRPWELQRS